MPDDKGTIASAPRTHEALTCIGQMSGGAPVVVPYADVRRVEPDEVKSWLDAGSDVVVDVRPAESYAARHIPGALSLSSRAIEDGTRDLPQGKGIVLY